MPAAEFVDLYEILQVSPNAEKDTIKRVHQILSLKYQLASNGNTGNSDFAKLQEAAATLLDSQTRAAYDLQRLAYFASPIPSAGPALAPSAAPTPAGAAHGVSGSRVQPAAEAERASGATPPLASAPPATPAPALEPEPATPGTPEEEKAKELANVNRFTEGLDITEEKRRRAGLVEICYRQRILKPRQPALSVKQLEDGLGLTVHEMEASMWYLKETDLLRVSDAGNYAVTAKGMDAIEGGYIRFADCHFDMASFNR